MSKKTATKKTATKEEAVEEEVQNDMGDNEDGLRLSEDVKNPSMKKEGNIEVGDPQVLRPRELPLVVKPAKGDWANDEQAAYASNLNAYAYRNPEKWNEKKDQLIARLEEIGKDPSKFGLYAGRNTRLSYNNQLIGEK